MKIKISYLEVSNRHESAFLQLSEDSSIFVIKRFGHANEWIIQINTTRMNNSENKKSDPNRMVCYCLKVTYLDIKKAMVAGARTVEDIKGATGAGTACGGCLNNIEQILSGVCGCHNVTVDTVLEAINNGAETVEQVGHDTGAGRACGRCQPLVQNIIDLKR